MDYIASLKAAGFRFTKSLGQNFIFDRNLLSAIVCDAGIMNSDSVLEIGTGAGSLTRALSEKAGRVVSFEIDEKLRAVHGITLEGLENVSVVYDDALKVPLEAIEQMFEGRYKVVANLPYYITTPLIFRFLDSERVESITIMVQKEVADRLVAAPSTADYGALTVAVNARARVCIVRNVARSVFMPPPNVDSAVVKIEIRHNSGVDYAALRRVVKAAFAMRRKTLVNNLCAALGIMRSACENAVEKLGLDVRVRGEALSVEQFIELSKII